MPHPKMPFVFTTSLRCPFLLVLAAFFFSFAVKAQETPAFQSDHTRARNILNLAQTNQAQEAIEQVDPSLADTVRSMDPASQRTFAYLFNEKGVRLANEQKVS